MALRCFVEELNDTTLLQPILPQLMDSIFKLMGEVRGFQQGVLQHPTARGFVCQYRASLCVPLARPLSHP
jgi:hypothetical protein